MFSCLWMGTLVTRIRPSGVLALRQVCSVFRTKTKILLGLVQTQVSLPATEHILKREAIVTEQIGSSRS